MQSKLNLQASSGKEGVPSGHDDPWLTRDRLLSGSLKDHCSDGEKGGNALRLKKPAAGWDSLLLDVGCLETSYAL
ncbi:rCG51907 [Rattus norvegicus]|uniref:RCG51907 n=1 Tax=Rattus norvegicus TaxID=10116 RepID=A6K3G3_RAT|nr:rCG51907 [Rattus norvegicus]